MAFSLQQVQDIVFRGERDAFQQYIGTLPGKGDIPVAENDIIRDAAQGGRHVLLTRQAGSHVVFCKKTLIETGFTD